jgi:hypothetical protein
MKPVMFLIYFTVNLLFVIKYGVRQDKIDVSVLVGIFALFHILIYKSNQFFINKLKITKTFLYLFLGAVVFIFILLCHLIDSPYKVNIDRWQTIEYCLKDWLNGDFFYDKPNFIGQMPSYLPGQLLAAVGFYLVGNVGYLQIAAFIIFVASVFSFFSNNNIRFIASFLLIISLSFIYEIVCKSDFISSFIFTIAFIVFWHKKFSDNYFAKPLLLGIILGFLCLTRSLVIIPIILFLLNPFFKANNSEKLKSVVGFLMSFSFLLSTVILPVKSFEYLQEFNPLKTQGQGSGYIMLIFLIVTVVISRFVQNIQQIFFYSAIIYFLLIGSFLIESSLSGIVYNNLGITYLASSLPFAIIGYAYCLSDNLAKTTN